MTAAALLLYWATGIAWLMTGIIRGPVPLGWLQHNMPPVVAAVYVVVGGAIWPLIAGKILWRMIVHGDEKVDL